jgi:hypothetical protein
MQRWSKLLDMDNVLDAVGLARANRGTGVGSFFVGIGIGVIAGGAAALLLTPYRGAETRERLLRAGEDLGRTVSTKVNEIAGRAGATNNGTAGSESSMRAGSYPEGTRIGGY